MTSTMAAAVPDPAPALAWSQADDVPESADGDGWTGARPYVEFVAEPQQSGEADVVAPWHRRPALAVVPPQRCCWSPQAGSASR